MFGARFTRNRSHRICGVAIIEIKQQDKISRPIESERGVNIMTEFINESKYEFDDISSETYREYVFPGNERIRIENPKKLAVSGSGHRVWDGRKSHFIPKGWIHLFWEVGDGMPNYVK